MNASQLTDYQLGEVEYAGYTITLVDSTITGSMNVPS